MPKCLCSALTAAQNQDSAFINQEVKKQGCKEVRSWLLLILTSLLPVSLPLLVEYMKKSIQEIAKKDGRYSPRAFQFVHEGLEYTVKKFYPNVQRPGDELHHISGKQLCEGLADLAAEKWGRMAKVTLNQLGIKSTNDFGNIVYLLVENKWMHARAEDSIEEFNNVYDFEEVFEKNYKFKNL